MYVCSIIFKYNKNKGPLKILYLRIYIMIKKCLIASCFLMNMLNAIDLHLSFKVMHGQFSKIPDYVHPSDIPTNKNNKKEIALPYKLVHEISGITKNLFYDAIRQCMEVSHTYLTNDNNWILKKSLFNNASSFAPYVMGIKVAPATDLYLLADRHGDIKSTIAIIKPLLNDAGQLRNKNMRIIFLGDYVDRGIAGVEVLYYIARLKTANPDQVFMVRGNHEDVSINQRFGFTQEISAKFGPVSVQELDLINDFYNTLPVALFIGSGNENETHYALCCHGFIDPRYSPINLFNILSNISVDQHVYDAYNISVTRSTYHAKTISLLNNKDSKNSFFTTRATSLYDIDFLWADIVDIPLQESLLIKETRPGCLGYGKHFTESLMHEWSTQMATSWWEKIWPRKKAHCSALGWIFRGHQHAGPGSWEESPYMMNRLWQSWGVARAWSSHTVQEQELIPYHTAYTLLVAPHTPYGILSDKYIKDGGLYPGFNYDTMLKVTTGAQKNEWRMHRINKKMFKKLERSVRVNEKVIIPYV